MFYDINVVNFPPRILQMVLNLNIFQSIELNICIEVEHTSLRSFRNGNFLTTREYLQV